MCSNIVAQTSLCGKQQGYRSILLISLQLIEYEKIHVVHSNELAKGYIMIPVSFFMDQYRGKRAPHKPKVGLSAPTPYK